MAVLANVPLFQCLGSRISKIIVFFLPAYLFSEKGLDEWLITGSHERAFSSCHVVGVTQEDASRIGRRKELLVGVASAPNFQLNCCPPPQVVW